MLCQSVRARDLSGASGGESGVRSRVRPGTPGDRCSAVRLETGPGSWGSEREISGVRTRVWARHAAMFTLQTLQ